MNIYIMKNGNRLGPFTIAEVNRLRANGEIQNTDWAWHDEIPDWVPLSQLMGLSPAQSFPVGMPTPPPVHGQTGQTPTGARWATAIAIFCVSFVIGFFILFILCCAVGGAIVGAQASATHHAATYDAGYAVGQEAGRAFGKAYGPIMAGCSALASFVLSLILAFSLSFSNILPWCRRT